MRSPHYIPPKDVSKLVGKEIDLVVSNWERKRFKIKSICYSKEDDLYQGQTEENFVFSLSRVKMENILKTFADLPFEIV
jgi:hypothetical protein